MKKMKKNTYTKLYGILGYVLCGSAGAALGFMSGGFSLALLGVLPGALFGRLFEKAVEKRT